MELAGIVEAFDVSNEIPTRFGPCAVGAVVHTLDLQGVEEASIGALSRQFPFRLIDGEISAAARAWRYSSAVY
jgi:hypothetical protein